MACRAGHCPVLTFSSAGICKQQLVVRSARGLSRSCNMLYVMRNTQSQGHGSPLPTVLSVMPSGQRLANWRGCPCVSGNSHATNTILFSTVLCTH